MGTEPDTVILGDALQVLTGLPDECVDFIITSPPYANNRSKAYGGVPITQYVEWFVPISEQLRRVLRPRGSFILNIKERVHNGERATYVMELILAMKKQGWLWIEEYIWHKKNCYPGKWPNRFRDAWERCLHFTKQKQFNMYQEAVMVSIGDWSKRRLSSLGPNDLVRTESKVQSGFGKNVSNWVDRRLVYPSNVLHLPTECSNRGHPATFPRALASWFIKLFTQPGEVVLDPFLGSGTTALSCIDLGRHFVGIELMESYYRLSRAVIEQRNVGTWYAGDGGSSSRVASDTRGRAAQLLAVNAPAELMLHHKG